MIKSMCLFFILTSFLFSNLSLAISKCHCLCSVFYTRGGENKFCPEFPSNKIRCDDWFYEVPTATSNKQCYLLGENLNECNGFFKEQKTNSQWTQGVGGRFHSCKFF
ncbi:MAG: hypothetical protein NT000_01175 [Proteobacteria bacterium]|nr:hypothetical protein [Pseudomonadota bacterium]